jgi:hypothetical protein
VARYLGIAAPEGGEPARGGERRARRSADGATSANASPLEEAGRRGDGSGRVAFRAKPGEDAGFELVPVEVGLRNWELTEIKSGLAEGERVALVPSGGQLRQSADWRDRMQRMRGLPGQTQGGGSGQRGRGNP